MRANIKILIITIVALLSYSNLKSQSASSIYFLETIPQSNLINIAHAPRANVFIGLPVANTIFFRYNSNLAINTLVQQHNSKAVLPVSQYYNFDKLYKNIGKKANVLSSFEISPIFFGFKMGKKGYVTISNSLKFKTNMRIGKGFFSMVDKLFPDNSNYSIKKTGIDAKLYNELSVGYSRNFTKKLRFGARVKVLQGLVAVKTDIKKANLYTSKKYWNVDVDGSVYSSGPLKVFSDAEGKIDSVKLKKEYENADVTTILQENLLNLSNNGLAIDLGVHYQFNHQWSVSASLNDLGFIRWRKNLNAIHFNGKYKYEGVTVNNNNIDTIQQVFESLVDTLKEKADYRASNKAFNTGIGTQFNVGGQYHVNHVMSVGLLSRTTFDKDYIHQLFNVSANFNLYSTLSASLNYNIALSGENSAGLALALRAGILQFYMVLDHIPVVFNKYSIDNNEYPVPADFRAFNAMLGFNILFGAGGFKDQPKFNNFSAF